MNKSGPKPKSKIKIEWSANFAYAIGLIVSDGCLYKTGRHINFTSKDLEQINNFQKALGIDYKIGKKARGKEKEKKYFVIQIGDVNFFNFLLSIGITPAKSLTVGEIKIPDALFFDYLRGCLDGDGYTYSYWDPRWKSSFMFYMGFCSASEKYINWLHLSVERLIGLKGHITSALKKNRIYQLKYSKYEAIKLAKELYKDDDSIRLSRKHLKISQTLAIVHAHKGRVFVK